MAIITKRQVLIILIFKLCLPTFDVYSDVGTAYELFTIDPQRRSSKPLFRALGSCTILFMILGLIFTIPHFLRNETTWKRRLLTLPFLLALCCSYDPLLLWNAISRVPLGLLILDIQYYGRWIKKGEKNLNLDTVWQFLWSTFEVEL